MSQETVVSTRRVYDGRILNLRVDDVRLPNGVAAVREVVEHRGAVAIVAIDADDHVLLVKQYRAATQRTLAEVPAGTLEPGEEPARCAARELIEETGYSAARWEHLGGIYPSPGFCTEYIHLFLATDLTRGAAQPEADEQIAVEVVPWAEALRRVYAGEVCDGKSVSALLLVAARR